MGKRAFNPAWDGKAPVEGLTMVAPAPEPKPAPPAAEAIPEAILEAAAETPEATAPAAEPAAPAPANGISLDQLQAFTAILLVKRLREMREEEAKKQ